MSSSKPSATSSHTIPTTSLPTNGCDPESRNPVMRPRAAMLHGFTNSCMRQTGQLLPYGAAALATGAAAYGIWLACTTQ